MDHSSDSLSIPDLNQLITDLGPLLEALEIQTDEAGRWLVALDEELIILMEQDVDTGKLVLSVEVGRPPTGLELDAYKMLLQVNASWRDTGGLRFGLEPEGDMVTQILDVSLAGLDLEGLRLVTAQFAATALDARTLLAEMAQGEAVDFATMQHFTRV